MLLPLCLLLSSAVPSAAAPRRATATLASVGPAADEPRLLSSSLALLEPRREPSPFGVSGLSRDELWGLRLTLEDERPSLIPPLVVLGTGAASAVLGLGGIAAGAFSPANQTIKTALYAGGGVFVLIGAAISVGGAFFLKHVLKVRSLYGLKIQAVDEALEQKRQEQAAPPRTDQT